MSKGSKRKGNVQKIINMKLKKQLLRRIILPSISGLMFFSCTTRQEPQKPNVIIVLSDDQGYGDFSCYGNPVLKTPTLDKLCNESVSFSNFHVAPVCTPTRGELMTGLNALNNKACMVPSGRNLMKRNILTMPEVFNKNGYRTGLFGKWHLGDTYPDRPFDRGFERAVWHKGWGLPSEAEYDNDYYKTRYIDQLETKQSDKYCADLWFDEAIKWMDEKASKDNPFFAYIALNTPHGPYYAKPEDKALYDATAKDSVTASFFGMIHNIDVNMEKMDSWLETKGIKDNTILVYMNDNGGTAGVKTYNAGMRGKKGDNYEGGHRGACFFRYPEKIKNAKLVNYPSHITDLLPTFIDMLGFDYGTKGNFDGESLKSYILGSETEGDRMFVVQYGGRIKPKKYYSCVVYNNWRLVGENELYDLSSDPGQKENIIKDFPDVASKMQAYYEEWWKDIEPTVEQMVPVVIDLEHENPTIVTSNTWTEVDVDNAWKVAAAMGDKKGGVWNLDVKKTGNYKIQLSRWPFHLDIPLTDAGPTHTVGGTLIFQKVEYGYSKDELIVLPNGGQLKPTVALPIDNASMLVNGQEVKAVSVPNAHSIDFELELKEGLQKLQAWFEDIDGRPLCGAYYMKVSNLN